MYPLISNLIDLNGYSTLLSWFSSLCSVFTPCLLSSQSIWLRVTSQTAMIEYWYISIFRDNQSVTFPFSFKVNPLNSDTYIMTCGDIEQCSKSKVQRKITKQEQSEHGSSKLEVHVRPGPEVIKLFWVRSRTPNRTPCSKSYSYSRYRGYKTFSYSYSYSGWVQKCDFLSKLWSFLKVVLKTFNLNKMQCKHIILFIL